MRRGFIVMALLLVAGSAVAAAPSKSETRRIAEAATVVRELRSAPDNGIPDGHAVAARGLLFGKNAERIPSANPFIAALNSQPRSAAKRRRVMAFQLSWKRHGSPKFGRRFIAV